METKYKTVKEIVEETVDYYSKNPRSVGKDGRCLYYGPNGERCAFSRVCKPNAELEEHISASEILYSNPSVLLPEYSLPYMEDESRRQFYNELQGLHDDSECWKEEGGLTLWGEQSVERIIKSYYETEKA